MNLKLVRTLPAVRWESGNVGRLKEHFLEIQQFSGKGRGNWKPTKCFTDAKRTPVAGLMRVGEGTEQGHLGHMGLYHLAQLNSEAILLIY